MTKRLLLLSLLVALLLMTVGQASAQGNGPVTAALRVPDGQHSVGDPIRLTLEVTHPAGYQVILPQIAPQWGDFTVVSQSPATTTVSQNGDGSEITTATIDARLFGTGSFNTPALELSVTDGRGNLQKVTAAPAGVTITSVLQAGDDALRDIKPQAVLPIVATWPWIVAGVLAIAALAVVIAQRASRTAASVDLRLPHEVALDDLARIEAMRLPAQDRFREHATLVSDTVRTYVERRYGIPMLERTTAEIRADLGQTDMAPDVTVLLVAFLRESDLVKFSKFTPDVESADRLLLHGRTLVSATAPAPAPDQADGGAAPRRVKRAGRRETAQSMEAVA
jgi:hypothetical protein